MTSEQEWFRQFIQTDEFSEALGIIWRFGYIHTVDNRFQLSHKSSHIVSRFSDLIIGASEPRSYFRKSKGFIEWECHIERSHPFLLEAQKMGWTPRLQQERLFPLGEFNESIFVKTYILMRHDVGIMREKTKNGILIRPRLRLHGSVDVLQNVCRVLHKDLNIKPKKLQTDWKVERAKAIYYQSKRDIPAILEYVGAWETLEKFNSFELGYEKTLTDEVHK
ncbi:hypothetical protein P9Y62_22005 [Bacillus thuringiensis]|uniref:Uncharacterized protein n=1 Tax=Bacillus thuringiensis HD-771 TaxID=1218175 RepID=A0A9W3JGU8_BACTU|nr:hypothetical protein [Bacillus thuringiensis]EEM37976.1 hypothetical protein bthur0004_61780 [Bacillus thuringiensis serovar sotto str. T04001]AFQ19878.1 hypothetical protein BTG_32733 [Bacillus thuringiensis HD-771]MEB4894515.1 hypothetical protein [Bacillus thuringiensis]MEC2473133.1 hypothetical protein [Bacillus thuringiensis]MEC2563985.1 hypothetical protein [Bacillus thuringiensis]